MTFTVYRLWALSGQLLYVGCTGRLEDRLTEHRATKPWWPEVAAVSIEQHLSRDAALKAEATAIRLEEPTYNTVHHGPYVRGLFGSCRVCGAWSHHLSPWPRAFCDVCMEAWRVSLAEPTDFARARRPVDFVVRPARSAHWEDGPLSLHDQ